MSHIHHIYIAFPYGVNALFHPVNVLSSDASTVEYVYTTEKEIMKQALAHLKAKQQGNASSTTTILDCAGACHLVDTSLTLLFGSQAEPERAVDAHIPPHIAIVQEIQ